MSCDICCNSRYSYTDCCHVPSCTEHYDMLMKIQCSIEECDDTPICIICLERNVIIVVNVINHIVTNTIQKNMYVIVQEK